MKKYFLYLFLVNALFYNKKVFGQKNKILISFNLTPSLGLSSINKVIISDGIWKTSSTSRKFQPVFGLGYTFIKPLENNYFIAVDLSYAHKGDFDVHATIQSSDGSFQSTQYSSKGISFLQTTASFGKKTNLRHSYQFFTRSIGVFHGINGLKIGNSFGNLVFDTNSKYDEGFGNDLGIALVCGIQIKRFIINGNFEKGIINYQNKNNIHLTTTIFGLKLGYQLLNFEDE